MNLVLGAISLASSLAIIVGRDEAFHYRKDDNSSMAVSRGVEKGCQARINIGDVFLSVFFSVPVRVLLVRLGALPKITEWFVVSYLPCLYSISTYLDT